MINGKTKSGTKFRTKDGRVVEFVALTNAKFAPVIGILDGKYGNWWPNGEYALSIVEGAYLVEEIKEDNK